MCGIAGFVGAGDERLLRAMADSLAHRGPDGAGYHIDAARPVFLAHRRLAILDLATGDQPMWNEDGQVGVVFNGEIYNHAELRRTLEAKGHVFRTHHSDTEVLVHGYEEWGTALPGRLNGMFAFAIYDRTRAQLFFARDRFGKKPLYYTCGKDFFAFASELTALLKYPQVQRSVDRVALRKYFAYGFIPAPRSLYTSVSKLPGGHWMTYDVATGTVQSAEYWRFRIEPQQTIPVNPESVWGEELRALLSQAVKRRLISDVPLGIFLSGGIDSSAILAFATKHVAREQNHTFSVGFEEASFDESRYAKQVAELFGSDHHHELLDLGRASELLPDILARLDEPMGDSSILPTFLLCRFARKHVTVALGGDGGDELFAGYDPFRALSFAGAYRRAVPQWLHRGLRSMAGWMPASERNMSLDFKIKRTLRGLGFREALWNPVWLGALDPAELQAFLDEPVDCEEVFDDAITAWNESSADNVVDKTLEFYTRFYLQGNILTKVDRASMMVSLEVRAPFLDNDVVEFARRIPHQYKYRNGCTKYLLKKALEPVLPKEILHRPKKGFGVPLARWLKEWQEPAEAPSSPKHDARWLGERWREHRAGRADHRLFLWCWIVLQSHLAATAQLRAA